MSIWPGLRESEKAFQRAGSHLIPETARSSLCGRFPVWLAHCWTVIGGSGDMTPETAGFVMVTLDWTFSSRLRCGALQGWWSLSLYGLTRTQIVYPKNLPCLRYSQGDDNSDPGRHLESLYLQMTLCVFTVGNYQCYAEIIKSE